jgi:hypothetical protein
VGSNPTLSASKKGTLMGAFFVGALRWRDSNGGSENSPVDCFPAPGFRVRPFCVVRRTSRTLPMTEIESHPRLNDGGDSKPRPRSGKIAPASLIRRAQLDISGALWV